MDAGHRDADLLQELYSTGLLVGLLVDEELAKAGVSQQLFSFLGWVSRLEPVTPGTLAAETGLPPTTIRDHVRRLVQRGVVCRRPNPADGRSYYLVLTPQGPTTCRPRLAGRGCGAYAYRPPSRAVRRAEHLAAARELREAVKSALAETERESHPSSP